MPAHAAAAAAVAAASFMGSGVGGGVDGNMGGPSSPNSAAQAAYMLAHHQHGQLDMSECKKGRIIFLFLFFVVNSPRSD